MSRGKRYFKADSDVLVDNRPYEQDEGQLESNQVENVNELEDAVYDSSMGTDNSNCVESVSSAPCKIPHEIPSIEEQRKIVDKLWEDFQTNKREGDLVYIIPEKWLFAFQNITVQKQIPLLPLDINSIVSDYENFILKDYSQYPYTAVPGSIFKLFKEWYGLTTNSKELCTYIIKDVNGNLVVEYDLIRYSLHHLSFYNDNNSTKYYQETNRAPIEFHASRLCKYEELKAKCREVFSREETTLEVNFKKIRMWHIRNSADMTKENGRAKLNYIVSPNAFVHLSRELFVESVYKNVVGKYDNHSISILVEVKGAIDGKHWPSNFFRYNKPVSSMGIIGLHNLGNTCYMNSALQCLLHIPEFNEYFLSGAYKNELNSSNPLGYSGHVARSFGRLVENLFGERYASITAFSPKNFKATIGHFNSIFAGYAQQDSQEFLAFLLDGLHEDLNRVIDKPYLEKPELPNDSDTSDPQQIKDLATRTWEYVRKRNDSIIMDLFVGLYKSTLICPNCNNMSITFDPYNDVTLPLPVEKFLTLKVTIFPYRSPPCLLEVELPKNSTYQDLKKYVASCTTMDIKDLYGFEIFNHQFYKTYEATMESDYLPLSELISINDFVVFYEVRRNPDDILFPVFNVELAEGYESPLLFGIPFLISLTKEEQGLYGAIRNKLEKAYQQFSGGFSDFSTIQSASYSIDFNDLPMLRSKYREMEWEPFSKHLKWVNPTVSPDEFFEIQVLSVNTSTNIRKNTRYGYERSDEQHRVPSDYIPTPISNFNHNNAVPMKDMLPKPVKDMYYYCEIPNNTTNEFQDADSTKESTIEEAHSFESSKPQKSYVETEGKNDDTIDMNNLLIRFENAIVCKWNSHTRAQVFKEEHDWDHPAVLNNDALNIARKEREVSSRKEITLDDCFDIFSRAEVLSAADSWYCPKCKQHTQASKQIELWNSPDILLVHLKRFENQRSFSDKIDAVVNFPIEGLDMTKHLYHKDKNTQNIYDLIAVDNHYGGLGGGHYTSYAKTADGKWYYFDDSRVTETSPMNSINGAAYLLFYRRRTDDCLGDDKLKNMIQEARKIRWEERQTFLEQVELAYNEGHSEEESDQMEDDTTP